MGGGPFSTLDSTRPAIAYLNTRGPPPPSALLKHLLLRILRGGQRSVDFDAADNSHLYATTMKATNFENGIPSIPIDFFKDHYVLVFDLTSMQNATQRCHYPELVGEPLRLELSFTFPPEHFTEFIVMGNECVWLRLAIFVLLGGKCQIDNVSPQRIIERIPVFSYRYLGSFPFDCVSTLPNETFSFFNGAANQHYAG